MRIVSHGLCKCKEALRVIGWAAASGKPSYLHVRKSRGIYKWRPLRAVVVGVVILAIAPALLPVVLQEKERMEPEPRDNSCRSTACAPRTSSPMSLKPRSARDVSLPSTSLDRFAAAVICVVTAEQESALYRTFVAYCRLRRLTLCLIDVSCVKIPLQGEGTGGCHCCRVPVPHSKYLHTCLTHRAPTHRRPLAAPISTGGSEYRYR